MKDLLAGQSWPVFYRNSMSRTSQKFILAQKRNMSQLFREDGSVVPVTYLEASSCIVTQVKRKETDGYDAVQVGLGTRKNLPKPVAGHLKTVGNKRYLAEFRVADPADFAVGQNIDVSVFTPGDVVKVTGEEKGRGFTGAVKRHGFRGAPASHGHDHPRAVGSIGTRFPQHTRKGVRMAGHMGGHWVTVRNLEVIAVDKERGILAVKGAVPGTIGGLVKITSLVLHSKKS